MTTLRAELAGTLGRVHAYTAWIRYRDILALQGAPLLGAVFALRASAMERVGGLLALVLANMLLVAHVFVLNDWSGIDADLNDANKRASVFAAKGLSRRGIRLLWIGLLASSLSLCGLFGLRTLALAAAIAALSALYSRSASPVKGVPILGSAFHLAGGMLHFLLGVSAFAAIDGAAIALAVFCGLAFTAGHLNQEVRDFDGDRDNRIRTNAVVFGRRRTFLAGLAVFTVTYAQLPLLAASGVIPGRLALLGLLYLPHLYWSLRALAEGLTFASISRLQARYRAIYAFIGAAMLSLLLF